MVAEMRVKERYLCVMTEDMFYCVDLCKKNVNGIAAVIESVRLRSSKLPVGMRSVEYPAGSRNFYLMGGEHQELLPWSSSIYRTVDLSLDVYKVMPAPLPDDDHHDSKKIKVDGGAGAGASSSYFLQKMDGADGTLPMMNDGKARPIIERIGDKIYALHSRVFDCYSQRPETVFEVLDPYQGKWNPLPDPFPAGDSAKIHDGMLMADQWLYVVGNVLSCYDTHTNEWHHGTAKGDASSIALGSRLLPHPLYKSEEVDDDYYVALAFSLEPLAYVLNSKGYLLACQNLYQMFEKYNIDLPFGGVLIPLEGKNRMCLVVTTSDHMLDFTSSRNNKSSTTRLYVWFFSIQPLPGALHTIHQISKEMEPNRPIRDLRQADFVHLNIEREFPLTIPLSDPFDYSLILAEHAFFL